MNQRLGLVSLELGARDLLLEMQNATRQCRGKECLVQSVIYMGQRVVSFVKDKSSCKCFLVTAKEQPRLHNSCRPFWLLCAKGCSLISVFAATNSSMLVTPSVSMEERK